MTRILYDGLDVFSGIAPTPYIQRSVSMLQAGERYGQLHTITLNGQLTGQCLSFIDRVERQKQLISGFSKDYQTLDIYDGDTGIYSYSGAKISNISFGDTPYNALIPFNISFEIYPSGFFGIYAGITEPKEEIKFDEGKDGIITITHTTSAKGNNTSSSTNNALTNAQSWVTARTGWSSQILPAFISGAGLNPCLQTIKETPNRLDGTYEIQEVYSSDLYSSLGGVLRYSLDLNSGIEEGITTVSVRGDIKGCRAGEISGLRARYEAFDAFQEANNYLFNLAGRSDLSSFPVTKSVGEDETFKKISFVYVYNDDLRGRIIFSYETSFDYSFETDIITASITANISSRDIIENRWPQVLAFANSLNLLSLLTDPYNIYVAEVAPHLASFPLFSHPISMGRTENEFAASIQLSARYSNENVPPAGLDAWDYTMNFYPALHQYSTAPILDGQGLYYTFDLGYDKRAVFSLNGTATASVGTSLADLEAITKNQALLAQQTYFPGTSKILDNQTLIFSNKSFSGILGVSASYSAVQPTFSL